MVMPHSLAVTLHWMCGLLLLFPNSDSPSPILASARDAPTCPPPFAA